MRIFLSFCVMGFALVIAENYLEEEDKTVIEDEKQFRGFYACMMDQGPCPDKLKTFREILPKYIETNCVQCSPKEKELYEKYRDMISDIYPKEFKDLLKKYGPKTQ